MDSFLNPNDSYSPSTIVDYGHMLSNSDYERTNAYSNKVLEAPVGIFFIGLIALLALCIGLFFRCMNVEAFICKPKFTYRNGEINMKALKRDEHINAVWLGLLSFLVLAFATFVFYGNALMTNGSNGIDESIVFLGSKFISMSNQNQDLQLDGINLLNAYVTANMTCDANRLMAMLGGGLSRFNTDLQIFASYNIPVINQLNSLQDDIELYGAYQLSAVVVVYVICMSSLLIFIVGYYRKSELVIQVGMAYGMMVFLIYILINILWATAVSLIADYCQSPSYNTIETVPNSDNEVEQIAMYYATCLGNNTLISSTSDAQMEVITMHGLLNQLLQIPRIPGQTCPNDISLMSMQTILQGTSKNFQVINDTLPCPPIQSVWFDGVNTHLCEEYYNGVFYGWGAQIWASFFLFWLIICASITYNYFHVDLSDTPRANTYREFGLDPQRRTDLDAGIARPSRLAVPSPSRNSPRRDSHRSRSTEDREGDSYDEIPNAGVAIYLGPDDTHYSLDRTINSRDDDISSIRSYSNSIRSQHTMLSSVRESVRLHTRDVERVESRTSDPRYQI